MKLDPITYEKVDGRKGNGGRLIPILDEIEVERALFRASFADFVRDAFEVAEGGDAHTEALARGAGAPRFVNGWHIEAIAEHLQAVADGQIRRLLINVPPGTMKSTIACVLWPAWLWARDPKLRLLFSSYSEAFTKRDARKAKALLQSAWYRARFPHVRLAAAPDTALEYHTTAGGERHGASTNSGVTGKHVHGILEDDPLKIQDAHSARAREEAWTYHSQALGFRLLPEQGWRVVVMQRLHEDDPSGRILAAQANDATGERYEHLCLPMEYEPARRCITSLGVADPREDPGELLWPARMGREFVDEKKGPTGIGEYAWAGQGQQRPAPAAGGLVKRAKLRYFEHTPPGLVDVRISCDLTFKATGASFYVVQAWGRTAEHAARRILLDQIRDRGDFPDQLRAIHRMISRWPDALEVVIEDAANGSAAIATLRDTIASPPVVAVRPDRSKEARLAAVLPEFDAENVWLPDPRLAPWVAAYVEEIVTFPNAENDDQVDATTQALLRFRRAAEQFAGVESLDLNMLDGARTSPWRN